MPRKSKKIRRSYIEDSLGNLMAVPRIPKVQRRTLTRPHRVLIRICESLGLSWEDEVKFGRYHADIFIKDYQLILECDGVYFHSLPGVAEKDEARDLLILETYGVYTLRFTDEEIYGSKQSVIKKIKEYIDAWKDKL